jgi:hypothetical protein
MVEVTPDNLPRDDLRFDGNFISPIDGTEIRSKQELHEHNRRHNVVQTTEGHNQDWAEREKERAGFYNSKAQKEERIEAVKESLYKLGVGDG